MLSINNKFEIGEECYTAYRKPIHYKCPICEGNGRFKHNGYDILCKNCNGSGKLHNPKQFVMEVCSVRVRRVIASIGNYETAIKYKVGFLDDVYSKSNKRCENHLFKTQEDAQKYCDVSNALTTEGLLNDSRYTNALPVLHMRW